MPSTSDQLRFAIGHRRRIALTYHGSKRVVEPHDYGIYKGLERVLVYQQHGPTRGPNRTGVGWRLLETSKITECAILAETFAGSRGGSHQRHLQWEVLYARVE